MNKTIAIALAAVARVAGCLVGYCVSHNQKIIIVAEVAIIENYIGSGMKCFISDADETYRVKNPRLLGFDSLDELNERAAIERVSVKVGKSYEIMTCEWGISLFSGWHKNIVSIKEVSV